MSSSRQIAPSGIRAAVCGLLLFFVGASAFAELLDTLQQRLVRAEHGYDTDAALALIADLQTHIAEEPSVDANIALARACLIVAESRRYDYEKAEGVMDPRDRRLLGRTIDDVANIGLGALSNVPDALSEKWRMSADFYGTMIRSNYKGSKYVTELEDATAKAVELDPSNPFALITASKRPLFAEENRGGNIPEAMDYLNKAIELNPKLERAYAFRGVGYEELGEMDKAIADWKKAIELSPNSRLAQEKLDEHSK